MKVPGIVVIDGAIFLGVPGRTFEITDEDLARLRMQPGQALIELGLAKKIPETKPLTGKDSSLKPIEISQGRQTEERGVCDGRSCDECDDLDWCMGREPKVLKEGEPCGHPGRLNHRSHPCEGCGRIGGQATVSRWHEKGYPFGTPRINEEG